MSLFDDARQPVTPGGFALWFLGVPLAVHTLMTLFFGAEAEAPGVMLTAVMMSAGVTGGAFAKVRLPPWAAVLAAAWPPALFAWRRWYWAVGMYSPGGSAQWLVGLFGWSEAPATGATAAVAAASALPGWALVRFDRWYERKTGHSLFEED